MWKFFPKSLRDRRICFQRTEKTSGQDFKQKCIFSARFIPPLTQYSSHSTSCDSDRIKEVIKHGKRENQSNRGECQTFGYDPDRIKGVMKYGKRGVCKTVGQDSHISCPITKVIPYFTQKFWFSSTKECNVNKGNERTKCGWKKHGKYKQQERTCRSSTHIEHSWLGALGWSSALILGWYMIQPLCYFWVRPHDKDRKCHRRHRLEHVMYDRERKHHLRQETRYVSLIETLYKTALSQPLYIQSKQDGEAVYDEPDGTSISLPMTDVPFEPSESEVQISNAYHELPAVDKIEINEFKDPQLDEIQKTHNIYGPQTAEEVIDEAAGNFLKVHTYSIGNIDNQLGVKYMQDKKYKKAVVHFKRAMEYKHAAATFNLGVCYEKGLGINQDFSQAAKYYHLASERGHATAMYNLGVFYVHGRGGLTVDYNRARELFEKASALNQIDAKRALEMKTGISQPGMNPTQPPKEKEFVSDNSTDVLLQALGILQKSSLNVAPDKHKIDESQNMDKDQKRMPYITLTDGQQLDVKDLSHLIQDTILKYTELRQK